MLLRGRFLSRAAVAGGRLPIARVVEAVIQTQTARRSDRMVPEVDLSQNLLPPGYPVVTPRHVALLLATWMLARIAEVVHDLLEATQRSEAKGTAASLPVQQGEPTLKAGSSVSKQPYSYGGVHAWTPLEARNFKVRCARRLPCDHSQPFALR